MVEWSKNIIWNNQDLINRQMWLAQQGMARERDYFVVQHNDIGFIDYVPEDQNANLYVGQYGQLTWVVNESKNSWYSYAKPYGIAEINKFKK